MFEAHRKIIKEFIDEDISSINTKWGCRGDYVLQLTVTEVALANRIIAFANSLNIETFVKHNIKSNLMYEVLCIVEDDDIPKLKSIL